jgi:acyl-coenzyme A synthetase/AMP-(fatty) acid ligase
VPLLVDLIAAFAAGLLALLGARWYARSPLTPVRERLSQYAYPRRIQFVDDLPKTLTGKIRRIELREREQQLTHHVSPQ